MRKLLSCLLALALLFSMVALLPIAAQAAGEIPITLGQTVNGAIPSGTERIDYTFTLDKDAKLQISLKAYAQATYLRIWSATDSDLEIDVGLASSLVVYPFKKSETRYLNKGTYNVSVRGTYNALASANDFEFQIKRLAQYSSTDLGMLGMSSSTRYPLETGKTVKGMLAANQDQSVYFQLSLSQPKYLQITCKMTGYGTYFSNPGLFTMPSPDMFVKLKRTKTYTRKVMLAATVSGGTDAPYKFGLDNDGWYDLKSQNAASFYTISVKEIKPPRGILKLPKTITLGVGAKIGEGAARPLPNVYDSKLTVHNSKDYVKWEPVDPASTLVTLNATNNGITAGAQPGSVVLKVTDPLLNKTGTITLVVKENKHLRTAPVVDKKLKLPQISLNSAEFDAAGNLNLTWFVYNNTGAAITGISAFRAYVYLEKDHSTRAHNGGRINVPFTPFPAPLAKGARTTFTMQVPANNVQGRTALDLTNGFWLDAGTAFFVTTNKGLAKAVMVHPDT